MMETTKVPWSTRSAAAILAVGVAVAHIADQGGVTDFNGTADWIGWAYRLTEIGAVATAALIVMAGASRLAWASAVSLAVGPAAAFVASRTVGLPGDTGDRGNWAWDVGALSLVVEVSLLVVSLGAWVTLTSARAATAPGSQCPELVR